jgi:hypothetical protein
LMPLAVAGVSSNGVVEAIASVAENKAGTQIPLPIPAAPTH